jgi:alpha-galactosidase
MFGVLADRTHGRALVAGFVSQANQFGSVDVACDRLAPSLRVRAQCDGVPISPGGELATEWAYFQFVATDDPDPLRGYAEAVARQHDVSLSAEIPAGWCSWYQYYKSISESHMLGNLAALRDLRGRMPLTVAQLDDGFEWAIGDWFDTNEKFAHGLGWLSKEIALAGFTPGLWLAPFILERGALLLREEPEWLLRDRLGRPVSAGWHWEKPSYALDMTHPGAQEHIQGLIEAAVHEWGYPYLKLDFLYAAALPGQRRDPTLTRAQTLRRALEMIRDAAGEDTFLVGCGCPLGAGVGIFDAMRIGPDMDQHWTPTYRNTTLFFAPEPGMPAARNAIRNALARLPLHGRWWLNDPDCLLARDTTGLTLDETLSLASVIALCGGMLFISDDMETLAPERRAIAEQLLPAVGQAAYALDWLDRTMPELLVLPLSGPTGEWRVVGLFNWGNAPADRSLDLAVLGLDASRLHYACDFWNRTRLRVSDGRLAFPRVPAHGVRLLAIRPVADGPQFVGSTLHFSQGTEVKEWRVANGELRTVIELGRAAEAAIWLALPGEAVKAEVDGVRTGAEPESDGVWRVEVRVRGRSEVKVRWEERGT